MQSLNQILEKKTVKRLFETAGNLDACNKSQCKAREIKSLRKKIFESQKQERDDITKRFTDKKLSTKEWLDKLMKLGEKAISEIESNENYKEYVKCSFEKCLRKWRDLVASELDSQRARLAHAERALKTEKLAERKKHFQKTKREARKKIRDIESVAKAKTYDPKIIMKALQMQTL